MKKINEEFELFVKKILRKLKKIKNLMKVQEIGLY